MPRLSARIDTLCNAVGAAPVALAIGALATGALTIGTPALADGADGASHNYPTIARIEYVQECVNRSGGKQGAMYQCSCAIDRIMEKYTYDEFVEASTFAKYSTLPGEGGGIFRDTDEAKQKAKLFRTVESEAFRACNVPATVK